MPPLPGTDDEFDDLNGQPDPADLDTLDPPDEEEPAPPDPGGDPDFDDISGPEAARREAERRKAEDDADADADPEDEAWRKRQSPNVQAAIDRQTARYHQERLARERAEAERDQYRTWLVDQAKVGTEREVKQAEGEIEDLRKQLAAAIESGETAQQMDLQEKLVDAKLKKREAEAKKAQIENTGQQVLRGRPSGQPGSEPNPARDNWMTRNGNWFNQKGFEEESDIARAIDARLIKQGSKPGTAEHWRKLNEQLARAIPDVVRGAPRRKSPGRSGPSGAPSDPGLRSKPGQVRLTAEDQAQMRQFRLDPGNPDHVKEFARNRRR